MTDLKSILTQYKDGKITIDKAQRLTEVLYGIRRSAVCMLDRLPKDCCIFQYTSSKDCSTCGHYKE